MYKKTTFGYGMWVPLSLSILLFFVSCSLQTIFSPAKSATLEQGIKIATWNTQTFFDANEAGTEFNDFKKKSGVWNKDLYLERIKRLCTVIEKIHADIFTLQEIENEDVLRDISNNLSYNSGYNHAAFVKEPESAFGIGILSRLPIESFKTHQITVRTAGEKQPDMRPLVEARFVIKSEEQPVELIVFACHWKSKSGGAAESDIWRARQEALLAESAIQATKENTQNSHKQIIVAAGDFNRDLSEFTKKPGGRFIFSTAGIERGDAINGITFLSPWSDYAPDDETGSYFYNSSWERIDHLFLAETDQNSPQVRLAQFTVEKTGPHVTAKGKPFRYNPATGAGYSDHFPLSALIIRENQGRSGQN